MVASTTNVGVYLQMMPIPVGAPLGITANPWPASVQNVLATNAAVGGTGRSDFSIVRLRPQATHTNNNFSVTVGGFTKAIDLTITAQ
jgi:hypothetical protein